MSMDTQPDRQQREELTCSVTRQHSKEATTVDKFGLGNIALKNLYI